MMVVATAAFDAATRARFLALPLLSVVKPKRLVPHRLPANHSRAAGTRTEKAAIDCNKLWENFVPD